MIYALVCPRPGNETLKNIAPNGAGARSAVGGREESPLGRGARPAGTRGVSRNLRICLFGDFYFVLRLPTWAEVPGRALTLSIPRCLRAKRRSANDEILEAYVCKNFSFYLAMMVVTEKLHCLSSYAIIDLTCDVPTCNMVQLN